MKEFVEWFTDPNWWALRVAGVLAVVMLIGMLFRKVDYTEQRTDNSAESYTPPPDPRLSSCPLGVNGKHEWTVSSTGEGKKHHSDGMDYLRPYYTYSKLLCSKCGEVVKVWGPSTGSS